MFRHLQRLSFEGACVVVTLLAAAVAGAVGGAVAYWTYDETGGQ